MLKPFSSSARVHKPILNFGGFGRFTLSKQSMERISASILNGSDVAELAKHEIKPLPLHPQPITKPFVVTSHHSNPCNQRSTCVEHETNLQETKEKGLRDTQNLQPKKTDEKKENSIEKLDPKSKKSLWEKLKGQGFGFPAGFAFRRADNDFKAEDASREKDEKRMRIEWRPNRYLLQGRKSKESVPKTNSLRAKTSNGLSNCAFTFSPNRCFQSESSYARSKFSKAFSKQVKDQMFPMQSKLKKAFVDGQVSLDCEGTKKEWKTRLTVAGKICFMIGASFMLIRVGKAIRGY